MVAGRQGDRTGLRGVLAVPEPQDKDPVRGAWGVPIQVEVRGRENRKGSTTLRRCRPYRTLIQGQ